MPSWFFGKTHLNIKMEIITRRKWDRYSQIIFLSAVPWRKQLSWQKITSSLSSKFKDISLKYMENTCEKNNNGIFNKEHLEMFLIKKMIFRILNTKKYK